MGKKRRFYADIMSFHPQVTGSCNFVTARYPDCSKSHFITDCGLFQGRGEEKYNNELLFNPKEVEFALVTHAHTDHVGRLPLLVRKGYENPILASYDTQRIMSLSLLDSAKVLKSNTKKKGEKPLYRDEDVDKTLGLVEGFIFEQTIHVNQNIDVTFFNNGHLFGASMILVEIRSFDEKPINILFTGDYKADNCFLDLKPLPDWLFNLPLTIVQESTYGDMESSEIEETFADNVVECIRKGGTVVIPAFALGRMQEVLYVLKQLQDEEDLPIEIPIFLDGKLGVKYTSMCKSGLLSLKEEMRDFLPQSIVYVDKKSRGSILQDQNSCKIIVTTSGMGSFGPAQTYIPAYITNPNALIQFTGYTTEGTLGRRLKDTPKGESVEVKGVMYRKAARVEYTNEFSAHAKADEMIAFLQQFKNLNLVLVNHGEEPVKEMFAERVMREVNTKNVGILGRRYFFRIDPYGLVESKPTKFM